MKPMHIAAMLALALLTTAPVQATDLGLTADLGTTGLGLHLSTPLRPNLNARFGFNYAKYSYTGSTSNVNYNFDLRLNTLDALLDYFPNDSGFRVSGGVSYNNNKVDAIGKPNASGTYTLNGNVYNSANAGVLNGKIAFRNVSPYLGVGWGNAVRKEAGWGLSADAGVLFQGSANTSLTNSGCTAPAPVCAQLGTDVGVENARLRDKADDLKLYPVIRVGASYRF